MWVVGYVKGRVGKGIMLYAKSWNRLVLQLVDASLRTNPDTLRAREANCTFIMENPLSEISTEQKLTSLHSAEAETHAQGSAAKQLVWVCLLMEGFGLYPYPALMVGDCQSARLIILNPTMHKSTKYFLPTVLRQRK